MKLYIGNALKKEMKIFGKILVSFGIIFGLIMIFETRDFGDFVLAFVPLIILSCASVYLIKGTKEGYIEIDEVKMTVVRWSQGTSPSGAPKGKKIKREDTFLLEEIVRIGHPKLLYGGPVESYLFPRFEGLIGIELKDRKKIEILVNDYKIKEINELLAIIEKETGIPQFDWNRLY